MTVDVYAIEGMPIDYIDSQDHKFRSSITLANAAKAIFQQQTACGGEIKEDYILVEFEALEFRHDAYHSIAEVAWCWTERESISGRYMYWNDHVLDGQN